MDIEREYRLNKTNIRRKYELKTAKEINDKV